MTNIRTIVRAYKFLRREVESLYDLEKKVFSHEAAVETEVCTGCYSCMDAIDNDSICYAHYISYPDILAVTFFCLFEKKIAEAHKCWGSDSTSAALKVLQKHGLVGRWTSVMSSPLS